MLKAVEVIAGIAIVLYIVDDVFQSVVVPRSTPARFRLTRWVVRPGWRLSRWLGLRSDSSNKRERMLGTFAPATTIVLLFLWITGEVFGFAFIFYGLGDQIRPPLTDFVSAFYFAGSRIGFGDFIAASGITRLIALLAGGVLVGTIALLISFVFSLYASFQRREVLIVTLDARAGAPPSGVSLLETIGKYGFQDDLPQLFSDWEKWAAEVLDSHLAYPILAYFRSSHDNESWVSALGAVLDATTLLLTTVVDGPRGPAKMMFGMGTHLVEDLSRFFRVDGDGEIGVERWEFDEARTRLAAAGWSLLGAEESWVAFSRLRSQYAGRLNTMAKWFAAPPTQWIGDRSYVRFPLRRHQDETPAIRVVSR
jgi:hypothetical protein